MAYQTLAQLANLLDAEYHGDADCQINGVAPLQTAQAGHLSFLENPQYLKFLPETKASVVILASDFLASCQTNAIVVPHPHYAYARLANLFDNAPSLPAGIHPSAVIDPSSNVHPSARIGPHVVIAAKVEVQRNVSIWANCVVSEGCVVGEETQLFPNVTFYHGVKIGKRGLVHSGAVIGADGFGFVKHEGAWTRVPQLGAVSLGDDVVIGANTTIDRGAMQDTKIGNDVKLDNLVQIGHNVQIGDHTAIAGCAGIAGSTKLGAHCLIGGGVGIAGHLKLVDNVSIVGMGSVSHSLKEAGVYSSGISVQPHRVWIKNAARLHSLNKMAWRIRRLEKQVEVLDSTLPKVE